MNQPTSMARFNGIDGSTGEPFHSPTDPIELGRRALTEGLGRVQLRHLRRSVADAQRRSLRPREGVDPRRLEETGWGVIFSQDADPSIREALEPLLEHRRRQATRRHAGRYRELTGKAGLRPGEKKRSFLARHRVGPGPVDPDRLPYYLMLVGEPEEIGFDVHYQLDVQHAVGRLSLDSPDAYACYAESVVAAEQRATSRSHERPRATFFAVRETGKTDSDETTRLLHDRLARPLYRRLAAEVDGWDFSELSGPAASKAELLRRLGGDLTPDFLFCCAHGLGFPNAHSRQLAEQGALVCQRSESDADHVLRGADLPDDARLEGLIAFYFACFSAGTPQRDGFAHHGTASGEPAVRELCPSPFVARLPQHMLSRPRGAALAVIGHIDRAWTYSFGWPGAGWQSEVFASCLHRLLGGHPVGSAMEYFNQRYAELECDCADQRRDLDPHDENGLAELGWLWTARNDARGFVVLGDPAVRLR